MGEAPLTSDSIPDLRLGRLLVDHEPVVARWSSDQAHVINAPNLKSLLAMMMDGEESSVRSTLDPSGAIWLPPIDEDARVFAVALNYASHQHETANSAMPSPLVFYKPPSAFVGHQGTILSHPELTDAMDYEGEIGIVIGRDCYRVSSRDALQNVAGIVALNDGSARDLLTIKTETGMFRDWLSSKSLNQASAIGPMIACGPTVLSAIADARLNVTTYLNGTRVQQGSTSDLIFSVGDLIAHLSSRLSLRVGDIIATGTPAGVGLARQRFLQPGDKLRIDVSMLPPLEVTVG